DDDDGADDQGDDAGNDDDGDDEGDDGGNDDRGDDDGANDDGDDDGGNDDGEPKPPTDDGDDGDDDGSTAEPCGGTSASLVPIGWGDASSVFEGWFSSYPADLSLDGDVGTSWFSAGPEADGSASTYEFVVTQDHCIDTIEIEGNGAHENSDFHIGFGFESVTVEVLDTANEVVFSEEYSMVGSPDALVAVDAGGVLGHRVRLSFEGHESQECGGFSELRVEGRERL
ncbi:MAG: hypothetical protein AAF721_16410, partial [Myxococcota bacterium]